MGVIQSMWFCWNRSICVRILGRFRWGALNFGYRLAGLLLFGQVIALSEADHAEISKSVE